LILQAQNIVSLKLTLSAKLSAKVVKKLYMAKTHQHNHRAQQLGMMQAGVVARQACLRPYSSPYTQANAPLTDKKWQNSKKMANFAAGMP